MLRLRTKIKLEVNGRNGWQNQHLQEIQCKQCKKFVAKRSYVSHKTVNGCKDLHKFIRLKHFKYAYENNKM